MIGDVPWRRTGRSSHLHHDTSVFTGRVLKATPSCSLVMKIRTGAASQQGHQTTVSRAGHWLIPGCLGICPDLGELTAGIQLDQNGMGDCLRGAVGAEG